MYSEVYTLFLFCQKAFSNMRQLLLCNQFYITEYFFIFLGKSCAARHPARTCAMLSHAPFARAALAAAGQPSARGCRRCKRPSPFGIAVPPGVPTARAGAMVGCQGAGCPRGHAGENCSLPEWFLICLCTSKLCIWKHCKCHPIPISLCIFSTLMLLLKLI